MKIYHIADFSSLGGVQTYLLSLGKNYPDLHSLLNVGRINIDIFGDYKNKNFINFFSIKFLFCDMEEKKFIVHNLILSKKWVIIRLILALKKCEIIYH